MRPGMVIKFNNDLHSVFSVEHRTPGNLRAFIQAKLRNLRTGSMFEHRFRSGDAIDKVTVDEVKMEYLYNDGDSYYFMNTENYEQTYLGKDVLGDAVDYLISLGHRRIACITNAPLAYTAASERLAGYRSALSAAGLPLEAARERPALEAGR